MVLGYVRRSLGIIEIQETEVLLSELHSLKKNAKVYKQQPNSNIFFLHDITKAKSETKEDLARTKAELENLSKK